MRLARYAAALGLLGLAPAAAKAAPGSDTFVEPRNFTVPSQNSATAVATCPSGSRVVGGGVGTTGPAPAGATEAPYRVMLSGPLDESGTTAGTDDGDVARH